MDLDELKERVLAFRDERDWKQFHTPRNLAAAIAVEAGEVIEALLWKTDEEIGSELSGELYADLGREVADVLLFALLLCDAIGIDPADAVCRKLQENAEKYPVELAKGSAVKYTRLRRGRDQS